jgi:rod shape determining protein RodA
MISNKVGKRVLFVNEFKILFIILFCLFAIGTVGQISAFDGEFVGSVHRHLWRIVGAVAIMVLTYLCDFRIWSNFAYAFYVFSLAALLLVEVIGVTKLGARRWLDLYFFSFQPSELMKLTIIIALARYYSMASTLELKQLHNHAIPILLTILPTALVLKQPDLGTAGVLFSVGCGVMFLAGFPKRAFVTCALTCLAACPFCWRFLHDYQKNRILTFLNPDTDPLGNGYHVLQSKIAIGSGSIFGKGFLQGTQSKLNFLPEKNTDFIFTTIAEENGFVGACSVIFLFFALTIYFFYISTKAKSIFPRLLCGGLGILLFLHVFVNIAMVIGVVPVVGIPLPFLSYGGSAMTTFAVSCGLVMASLAQRR